MRHVIGNIPSWCAVACLAAMLAGCQPQPTTEPPITDPGPSAAERAAELESMRVNMIARHNARVALLTRFRSQGVIEFRWVDDEGTEHYEPQINARLWLQAPRHIALRGEKLGDTLLWLGSDADRFWLFDLTGDEGVLFLGRHEETRSAARNGAGLLVPPLALKGLLGLSPLPADAVLAAGGDGDPAAWSLTAPGAGGPVRLWLDEPAGFALRIEILNDAGEAVLTSVVTRYKSVPTPGIPQAGWPRLPTLIDIADLQGSISIKFALDGPTADVAEEDWDRLFDLDRLTEHLGPDRIETVGE
jgi:hypothetical protein